MGPMDWFKEATSFDFEYSSIFQLRLKFFFLDISFSPKTNMNIYSLCQSHSHMYVQYLKVLV
jgi:hypothetical protein